MSNKKMRLYLIWVFFHPPASCFLSRTGQQCRKAEEAEGSREEELDEDRSRKSSTSRPASGSGCSRKSGSARRRALRSAGTVGVGGAAGGAEDEDEEDFVASACSQGSRKGQGSEKESGEE